MKRIVSISNGCFYNPYCKDDINRAIKIVSKLDIDGFEFFLGDADDLLKFRFSKSSLKILKNFKFNTIHAPFADRGKRLFFSKRKRSKHILKRIYSIYDKINAKNINMHPFQIKNCSVFDTINYSHSIENMEKIHDFSIDYYKAALLNLPDFKFVLDVSHAGESGEINKLIRAFKKDIIYFHLSANYYSRLHLPLHALRKEYLNKLDIIKSYNFPFVIESQIESCRLDEYKKEVQFVRKWLNS